MKILQSEGIEGPGGKLYKVKSYSKLHTIDEMKTALVATGPFVAGVDVYTNFSQLIGGVVVPMPTGNRRGGHAILVTGYNDNFRRFKIKNSWGSSWAYRGYAWLPYKFMENYGHTAWAAIDLKDEIAGAFVNVRALEKDLEKAKNQKKGG